LHGLHGALQVQPEQHLLIFGIGSVGQAAVQLAKRLQARVFAVASGEDSIALARAAGADQVFNGKGDGDLAGAIRQFAPAGLDGVLATANGKGLDTAIASVRTGGRLAYPTGVQPEPRGSAGVQAIAYNGTPDRQTYDLLNSLIEVGPFEVQVDETFPLKEAARAQEAMEKHHLGRMVLIPTS
jgi:NADPH:quinone reductase-like Zn-dependent oxidoreductase